MFLDEEARRVYDNRYVLWGHMRWGLVTDYEVYEDTQEAKRFDEHLTAGAENVASMRPAACLFAMLSGTHYLRTTAI